MGLMVAWKVASPHQVGAIVDTVRTRVLDLALALERLSPSLGVKGFDPPPTASVHQIVNTHIYGGTANLAPQTRAMPRSSQLRQVT